MSSDAPARVPRHSPRSRVGLVCSSMRNFLAGVILYGLVTRISGRIPLVLPCPEKWSLAREASTFSEVAIHWNSGFSRFRDHLDAKLERRETIEYPKRQDGRRFISMIHLETPVIERCPICQD